MKNRIPRGVCRRQRRRHKQAADSNGINRRPEPGQVQPAVSIRIHTITV
jgi:IS5 family transposase